MSGAKGIGYRVESAEQREARELAAARVQWDDVARRRNALAQRCAAHGLDALAAVPVSPRTTAASVKEATERLGRAIAAAEARLEQTLRERELAEIRATLDAVARAVTSDEGGEAGTATTRRQRAATPSASAGTAEPRTTGTSSSPANADEQRRVRARLDTILARQTIVYPGLATRADEILRASPARATFLLDDLSSAVARHNSEVAKERARARAAEETALADAAQRAAYDSDRAFVLGAVVASLEDLGYAALPTSTDVPRDTALLSADDPAGYGVLARLDGNEIALRTVRLGTDHDAHRGLAADEHLCAAVPDLVGRLTARGVVPGRVRSVPAGALPPLEVDIPTSSPRTHTPAEDRRRTRNPRRREAP